MPLTAQTLNLFNSQALPLAQSGISLLPQFAAPYKEGVSYTKRVPNCQKCGQHGRKSRLKGHKRVCPFKDCNCAKCQVVTERQKLMADQIKIRRRQRKDNIMSMTRENLKALNAVAAAADNIPYINNLNMICKQIAQAQPAQSEADSATTLNPTTSLGLSASIGASQPYQSSAFSPPHQGSSHSGGDSPQLISSPMSTIGDVSLSPLQHPRAYSFDLGFLSGPSNVAAPVPSTTSEQQLLSAVLSANAAVAASQAQQQQEALVTSIATSIANSTSAGAVFGTSPPQSTGLAAPIPVNPATQPATTAAPAASYEQLLALAQLLSLNQPAPAAVQPQLFQQPQVVAPQPAAAPQLNLQDVISLASLLLQSQQCQQPHHQQHHQLSPLPEEKPATNQNNNNFIDVLSV